MLCYLSGLLLGAKTVARMIPSGALVESCYLFSMLIFLITLAVNKLSGLEERYHSGKLVQV